MNNKKKILLKGGDLKTEFIAYLINKNTSQVFRDTLEQVSNENQLFKKYIENLNVFETKINELYEKLKRNNNTESITNILEKINNFNNDIEKELIDFGKNIKNEPFFQTNNWEKIFKLLKKDFDTNSNINEITSDNIKNLSDIDKSLNILLEQINTNINNNSYMLKYINNINLEFAEEKEEIYEYGSILKLDNTILDINNISSILEPLNIIVPPIIGQMGENTALIDADLFNSTISNINNYYNQNGGNISYLIHNDLNNINLFIQQISYKLILLRKKIKIFYITSNHYWYYILFILSTNLYPIFKDGLVLYKYINLGIIGFYYSIINNILNKNDGDIIILFKKKYFYILKILQIFFKKILNDKSLENKIININKSNEYVQFYFNLFNHFKDILDSYYENYLPKISIYSIINDWGLTLELSNDKLVFSKKDNFNISVNKNNCPNLHDNRIEEINFTEVFDRRIQKKNETIAKYMVLETQITKQKGILLLTYGYSGTGKTFLLFGSEEKQGILQATLNNIRNLESALFRVYEIYGLAFAYPHYWKHEINQKLIQYDINNDLTINRTNDLNYEDIDNFLNNNDSYVEINDIKNVFKNFSNFINNLDEIRKNEGRIKITPNNPESSRSIIIFELLLKIQLANTTNYVPLIIIDLPGRENIISTYYDNYINNITKLNCRELCNFNLFQKALLSGISLNPLMLSILTPTYIFEIANKYKNENIFNTINEKIINIHNKYEEKPYDYDHDRKLGEYLYEYNNRKGFELIVNDKQNPFQEKILNLKEGSKYYLQISRSINNIQYQGVVALFVLDSIIMHNRFDILSDIYKKIIDKYIDKTILKNRIDEEYNTHEKRCDFLIDNGFVDNIHIEKLRNNTQNNINTINTMIDQLINFRYLLSQHEGIYINENIMSLINFILTNKNLLNKENKNIIEMQSSELNFETQKNIIRTENLYLYQQSECGECKQYENIFINNNILNKLIESTTHEIEINIPPSHDPTKQTQYNKSHETIKIQPYKSNKMFSDPNNNKTIIDKIMKFYVDNKKQINNIDISSIFNVKIFYLLTNTQLEFKCAHQYGLLNDTKDIINIII